MADVVIYTKPGCPYCFAAMGLLKRKGADYTEIVASNDPERKAEMVERSGGRAVHPDARRLERAGTASRPARGGGGRSGS